MPRLARLALALAVLAALGLWMARGAAAGRRAETGRAPAFENRTDLPVESVTVDLLREGAVLGSTTVQYADGAPVTTGDSLALELSALPAGDGACRFRLCANTARGPVYGPALSLSRWEEGLRAALVRRENGLGFCIWSE